VFEAPRRLLHKGDISGFRVQRRDEVALTIAGRRVQLADHAKFEREISYATVGVPQQVRQVGQHRQATDVDMQANQRRGRGGARKPGEEVPSSGAVLHVNMRQLRLVQAEGRLMGIRPAPVQLYVRKPKRHDVAICGQVPHQRKRAHGH
jgi:hypothetical protein